MTKTIDETVAVALRDVRVRYKKRAEHWAVDGVSLDIRPGSILGLVGESGSGKSTIGRLCLGLLAPTEGDVEVLGHRLPRSRPARGRVGVVFQNPMSALDPRMRARDAVAEAFHGERGERSDRVDEMLRLVGLDPALGLRFPHELSGGQCQRVSIARAMVNEPDFVVFDEAVSALDVSVQLQILNLIKETQKKKSFSALFISHDIGAVRYLCDAIAVLRRGAVVEQGPVERFYGHAENEYTRRLLAASHLH
jgi:ABC-type glutathione transport system ATPase component